VSDGSCGLDHMCILSRAVPAWQVRRRRAAREPDALEEECEIVPVSPCHPSLARRVELWASHPWLQEGKNTQIYLTPMSCTLWWRASHCCCGRGEGGGEWELSL
jgi:hypothetical protein